MLSEQLPDELTVPDGWTLKPLSAICRIFSGGTPRKSVTEYWEGDIPWVSGKDLKVPRLVDAIDHVSPKAIGAGTRTVPADTVFVLVRGMGLAKDLPVSVAAREMAFNQDIKALVPKSAGTGAFIRGAIYEHRARLLARIVPSAHGTLTLNLDDIETFHIPFPEDPSVATTVGKVLNLLQDKAEQVVLELESAEKLKRAAMRALFTKGLRGEAQKETEIGPIPESWELKPLGTHFSVVSGGTPSRRNPTFWHDGEIPWAKTTEVNYCVIRETEEHITPAGLIGSAAKLLPPGTLLMAMYGQGVTRGKVAILGIEAACNQACAAIRPSSGAIETRFLYHFLVSRYEEIRQLAHGGQQQNLNLEIVRGLSICCPPEKAEQNEIVAVLDAIDRKIDLHRRKRTVLDELFKALLHKLMTGEIRVADLDLSALSPDPDPSDSKTPEVAA